METVLGSGVSGFLGGRGVVELVFPSPYLLHAPSSVVTRSSVGACSGLLFVLVGRQARMRGQSL